MTDQTDKKRQIQKNKLKAGLVDRDTVPKKEQSRAPLVAVAVIAALIAIAGFFVYRFRTRLATETEILWQKDLVGGEETSVFRGYQPFCGGMIMYSRDGAEFTDGKGNSVWQRSFQMEDPAISTGGQCAVIYDRGGKQFFIFSESGVTGEAAAAMPVVKAAVSGKGVVYAVLSDADAAYIEAYRKDGTAIDLSVKSVVTGDGYPFDIAVSPDGSQLITSYVSVSDGEVKESVVFRNFGDVGQNADSRRVVGGFIKEFEGHIVTRVTFPDDTHAHAFYDGGIVFFSTKVLNSPEIVEHIRPEGTILSIAEGGDHTAIIVEEASGTRTLQIYDITGKLTGTADITANYTGFTVGEKKVLLYNQKNIYGYSFSGNQILAAKYDGKAAAAADTTSFRDIIIADGSMLTRISVK